MKVDSCKKSRFCFDFEKKVLCTIEKNGLISPCENVLVALSGGADSVCLLIVLTELSKKHGFKVSACHLNHGIRKDTAKRDQDFSKNLCEKYDIPFYSETINVPEIKKNCGGSVETVAREERYTFFERAAKKLCCDKIATAHTMSDNAETVLFNLARGASSDGISGIPVIRETFIRPLINCTRAEIEDYLSDMSQDFVTDETNSDIEYTRNFLRLSVIPELKKINPLFEDAVFRLSQSATSDKEYFETETEKLVEKNPSVSQLCDLHPALLHRYIRKFCENSGTYADTNRINAIVCAMKETICSGGTKEISLPENMVAVISAKKLYIEKNSDKKTVSFNIPLVYGNNTINEDYHIFVGKKDDVLPETLKTEDKIFKLDKTIKCLTDIAESGIYAKSREDGDTVFISGMTRKIKKVFSETKLDPKKRALIPLVCDKNNNVIALPIFSIPSDFAKPISDKEYVQIAFYKAN